MFLLQISASLLIGAVFLTTSSAFTVITTTNEGACNSLTNELSPFGVSRGIGFQQQLSYPSFDSALNIRRGGRPRGPLRTFEVKPPMNEEVAREHKEVRVTMLNEDGNDDVLGIMSSRDALAKAKEMKVDLVMINPNGDPPVCKIIEYSKFRYMKEKNAKEKKKNAKQSEVKEVKMSYKIDTHDYDVRTNTAMKFLSKGNRVKATVVFKGREQQHTDLGRTLLVKFGEDLSEVAQMEGKPRQEGRFLSAFFNPKAEIVKKLNEKKRKAEKAKKKKLQESKEAMNAAAAKDEKDEKKKKIDLDTLLSDEDDDIINDEDDLLAALGGSGDDLFL
mmetsp:Transcript_20874/g.47388  ORF Transcript_20874/g.47388 Transcript_20874/m.47388 type:complete len:332 (-) Transcript_20874:182-1177(-)|eukprot:CAMPEP_0113307180 /NCGR_PEP_ID=MMETSP0010_2-20120614/6129_1 /TAXON_ID=216773 ORGANISM="Corethron hystrix, Strain 308" /NCGR_SAMPLE_ID=MMETSP0010_2 /ASSEMBLY_ACC=CAM_ASM_000155 /LENGTH=331 /DNA_ID=CAMNT_0000161985 /DNA_START=125 /DNA_END=1120 /DNA_ORIENTATION=+ /assembly_acc=CAM_ASM_000155